MVPRTSAVTQSNRDTKQKAESSCKIESDVKTKSPGCATRKRGRQPRATASTMVETSIISRGSMDDSLPTSDVLTQICLVGNYPTKDFSFLPQLVAVLTEYRSWNSSTDCCTELEKPKSQHEKKKKPANTELKLQQEKKKKPKLQQEKKKKPADMEQEKKKKPADMELVPNKFTEFLQACLRYKEKNYGQEAYQISLPAGLFINEKADIYVTIKEDITELCNCAELSATIITVYMGLLYNKINQMGFGDIFKFVNLMATYVSDNARRERAKFKFVETLYDLDEGSIVLMAFNPNFHWICIAIELVDWTVHYMDPRWSEIDPEFQLWLDDVYGWIKIKQGRPLPAKLTWCKCKVPKQTDGVKCGYFCIRYMSEIISNKGDKSIAELNFLHLPAKSKRTYNTKEIDEVRSEVVEYLDKVLAISG